MRKPVGYLIVALVAVLAVAWWWHGRSKSKHEAQRAATATAGGSGSAGGRLDGPTAAAELAGLEGRVGDAAGAPVSGATVLAMTRDGDPVTVGARADGTFAFDPLPPGSYTVVAAAPGFVPQRKVVALAAGGTQRVELTLASGGATLRGTVTDASAGPISGATVTARPQRGFGVVADDDAAGAAITDAEGRYALTLAPGAYRVSASHPEYVGASSTVEMGTADAGLDFRLVPGGAIEGVVKDLADGTPVEGATVIVERDRMGGWGEGRGRAQARTGAGGKFRVAGLVPGTLTLSARVDADGRQSAEPVIVPLGIAEQAEGVELWVRAAPYVAGTVVDDQGKPVADATVIAMGKNDLEMAHTDGAGAFRFVGLEPGTWQLTGSGERHQSAAPVPVTLADKPITGVVVKVARAPSVIGRVEPATAAKVELEQDALSFTTMGAGGSFSTFAGTTAGDDGRFELTPMEPGSHTIVAKAADGRRGKVTAEVPAVGSVEVVIHLDEAGSIAGKVSDQHGAPVAGAAVLVKAVTAGKRSTMIVNGVDALADRAPTAKDGTFYLRGLEAGSYELTVVDERGGRVRWAGAAPGKERTPVKVALAENEQKRGVALAVELDDGVIRGVVKNADGTPRADAWVSASARFEDMLPELPRPDDGDHETTEVSTQVMITADDEGGLGGSPPVLTDGQGRFELRGLRAGVYDVAAEADKGALRGKVERVATGTETAVTLAGLAAVAGTVTSNGAPVVDFTVELGEPMGPGRRQQTFHDAGGRFRFPRVDVGRYHVRVESAAGTGAADVVTEAGKTAEVTVALTAVATVRGRVVDAAGKPVAATPVLAMPVVGDGEHGMMTVEGSPELTGADGAFELQVEPGDKELLVLGGRGSPRTGKKFTAVGGQTIDLGTVALPAAPPPPPPRPK